MYLCSCIPCIYVHVYVFIEPKEQCSVDVVVKEEYYSGSSFGSKVLKMHDIGRKRKFGMLTHNHSDVKFKWHFVVSIFIFVTQNEMSSIKAL